MHLVLKCPLEKLVELLEVKGPLVKCFWVECLEVEHQLVNLVGDLVILHLKVEGQVI